MKQFGKTSPYLDYRTPSEISCSCGGEYEDDSPRRPDDGGRIHM
jgi:hypothetical protein